MDDENTLTQESMLSIPEPNDGYWEKEQELIVRYLEEEEKKFVFNEKKFLEFSQRLTEWSNEIKRLSQIIIAAEVQGNYVLANYLFEKKKVYLTKYPLF